VGHRDDRAGVVGQMAFEPGDALGVEMVRRFVEQQQIGVFEQQLAERDATLLAAGKLRHVGVGRGEIHRVHRDFDLAIEFPGVAGFDFVLQDSLTVHQLFHRVGIVGDLGVLLADLLELLQQRERAGDRFVDVAAHVLLRIEVRLLGEHADGEAFGQLRLAVVFLVDPRHDPQQRAFAGAIAAQDADLGAGVERQIDVFENFALANLLVEIGNLINEFLTHANRLFRWCGECCSSLAADAPRGGSDVWQARAKRGRGGANEWVQSLTPARLAAQDVILPLSLPEVQAP
jgi:hypothetical protein